MIGEHLGLTHLLDRSARRDASAIAIVDGDTSITYAQFQTDSLALAGHFQRMGVTRGDRVAVRLHNCEEVMCAYFACHALGAVCVPLNMRLSDEETAHVLRDCAPKAAVGETQSASAPWSELVPHWLLTDDDSDPQKSFSHARCGSPADIDPGSGSDAAFIMYTSGTTGWPKGAVLTHRNILVNTFSWALEVGVSRSDVWASPLPLFHIGGVVGVYPFLMLSARSHILPSVGFDSGIFLDVLSATGATMCALVPSQWDLVTQDPKAGDALAGIRRAIWGAAPASMTLLRRMESVLPSASVMCTFGQTEVTANATFLTPAQSAPKMGSVGRPSLAVECRVIDEKGNDVVPGNVGEIAYRGPTVMAGYWNQPEATEGAFIDGWFRSGDLVRVDADGFFYVVDRRKDMLISGGENVYPAEVERVLSDYPGIQDVAVVGVPDDRWGEIPVAFAVVDDDVQVEAALAFARGRLASYKVPRALRAVESLPRNATGKVRKNVLRSQWQDTVRKASDGSPINQDQEV